MASTDPDDGARANRLARFTQHDAATSVALLAAALVALGWANSPWRASYHELWSAGFRLDTGRLPGVAAGRSVGMTWHEVVNYALMALFFFVAGMEVKRELVVGALRDRRHAAVPVGAALGGMVVPALIYAAINRGGPGAAGWGIPMATDIAFALGVVGMLGSTVPPTVRVLLLTLAVVDDLGAIVVIAVFYAGTVRPWPLVAAAAVVATVAVALRRGAVAPVPLALVAAAVWVLVAASGVHATVAGVAVGMAVPVRAPGAPVDGDRAIRRVAPWAAWLVLPLFALANAGVEVTAATFSSPSRIFLGVVGGLVVGKFVGVLAGARLVVSAGVGRLPAGVTWGHLAAVAATAGIGFTVSIFVTTLAFDDDARRADATAGVLAASLVAALAGAAAFRRARRCRRGSRSSCRCGGLRRSRGRCPTASA